MPESLALVADPDVEVRESYSAILKPVVSEIAFAEDGREALVKAIERPPSLVIMETRLPFISGYALCSLLRADPPTAAVPIVVITGDANPGDIRRARSSGADSVLIKPCRPEALLQAIALGRDRSLQLDEYSSGASEQLHLRQAPPNSPVESSPPERSHRSLVRTHQRFATVAPPIEPPPLLCSSCDLLLRYVRSNIGGVTARFSEQWDYYECSSCCATFRYRQRTRELRRVP